jgi:hypothetical protein
MSLSSSIIEKELMQTLIISFAEYLRLKRPNWVTLGGAKELPSKLSARLRPKRKS